MSITALEQIKTLLRQQPVEEQQSILRALRTEYPMHELEGRWGITAEEVLEAVARSGDFTQRMFRGVLAEGACKVRVIDRLEGWEDLPISDQPYDFKIRRGSDTVKIQVKLQRSQNGEPLMANRATGCGDPAQYVVEVQKSRKGERGGASTRPIRFGEWDILAVSMWPATKDWSKFMFTLNRWLIPRAEDAQMIQIYQPIPELPNDDWTDDLSTCIEWLRSSVNKTIKGGGVKVVRVRKRKVAKSQSPPVTDLF